MPVTVCAEGKWKAATMATTTTPLEPWDHQTFYGWLCSIAMHGLRQELEEEMAAADDSDNHDLVPKKLHTEDTQVEFDPHWTELPSFTDSTTKKLKLIPWGSDKLVAVDMLYPPLARTPQHHPITFKVGVLRMNEQDRCWVRLPETPVIEVDYQIEDDMDWRRPQCVVLDCQLFIIHHVTETIAAIHSIDLNRSQQQQNQQAKQPQRTERFCRHGGWTTVRAALPKKFPLQSAASCVIGKSIVLLCKCGRPSGGEMSKEAIAYNTITKELSNLHLTDSSTTAADDELPYFGTHGAGAIRVRDSDFLVCPHFAEEGSEFLACNAANSNLSFAMAGYQDMDEDSCVATKFAMCCSSCLENDFISSTPRENISSKHQRTMNKRTLEELPNHSNLMVPTYPQDLGISLNLMILWGSIRSALSMAVSGTSMPALRAASRPTSTAPLTEVSALVSLGE